MKKMGNVNDEGSVGRGRKEGLGKLVDAMRDVPAMDLDVEKWTITDRDTVVDTVYSHSSGYPAIVDVYLEFTRMGALYNNHGIHIDSRPKEYRVFIKAPGGKVVFRERYPKEGSTGQDLWRLFELKLKEASQTKKDQTISKLISGGENE